MYNYESESRMDFSPQKLDIRCPEIVLKFNFVLQKKNNHNDNNRSSHKSSLRMWFLHKNARIEHNSALYSCKNKFRITRKRKKNDDKIKVFF